MVDVRLLRNNMAMINQLGKGLERFLERRKLFLIAAAMGCVSAVVHAASGRGPLQVGGLPVT
jgi:hypothetical protein